METTGNISYYAKNISDVLYHLKTLPLIGIYSGATTAIDLPPLSMIIGNVKELQTVDKHERYIDFGCSVTLANLLKLGRNNLPEVLYDAVSTIGTPFLKNVATMGGNLCCTNQYRIKPTLYSPLLALDAQIEVHSPSEVTWVSLSKFSYLPESSFISRIRVPTDDWEVAVFRRLGSPHEIKENSAFFTFLADTSKGTLADIRICFCSSLVIKDRDLENILLGARLPLSEREIAMLMDKAEELYDIQQANVELTGVQVPAIQKDQFLNLLRSSVQHLM